MAHSKVRGFTLIELLVVIAIIAILAAILFPVFSAAKEKGKRAACLSNAKQIGLALMRYVDDNDGRYPMAFVVNDPRGPIVPEVGKRCTDWKRRISRYMSKSLGLLICPSRPRFLWFGKDIDFVYKNGLYEALAGYTMNEALSGYLGSSPARMSQVARPSTCIAIIEMSYAGCYSTASIGWAMRFTGATAADFEGKPYNPITGGSYPQESQGLHSGGGQVVFADGHAKWSPYKEIASTQWDERTGSNTGFETKSQENFDLWGLYLVPGAREQYFH